MCGKNDLRAHAAFGETSRADGVPDCPSPQVGPVYLEGRLVLSLSFKRASGGALPDGIADEALESYRLWDDLAETWYDEDLMVLRFEQADVVVRQHLNTVVLWIGVVDTRARVIPEPDLDEAGIAANRECDLRWKRF